MCVCGGKKWRPWFAVVVVLGILLFPHHIAEASGPPTLPGGSDPVGSTPQPVSSPNQIDKERAETDKEKVLSITAGDSRLLEFDGLTRAAVGNPAVADVVVISGRELVVNAKAPGQTTLHVWDTKGVHFYRVEVDRGEARIAERVKELIGLEGVNVIEVGDAILLEGEVSSQNDLSRVEAITGIFGKKVINLLSVKNPLQVLLQVQVVEARRNLGRDLGIRWGGVTGQGSLQLPEGNLSSSVTPEVELMSPQIGLLGEVFVGSALERLSLFRARLEALAQQGLVKLLAAPSMLALSGSEANFLVGGEVPIFLGEEGGKIKFEWKPYGVQLKITPRVERQGLIDLKISPEVSSFDWENALLVNGWKVPAFKTRRAESHLLLADGTTIAIGGLIQSEDVKLQDKVPILGDLPIIGALFRSEKFQKQETELLIFVTPRIVGVGETVSLEAIKRPQIPDVSTGEVKR